MSPNVFILNSLLPLDALKLGRFIVNKDTPQESFLDPWVDTEPAKTVSDGEKFQTTNNDDFNSRLSLKLSSLLHLTYNREKGSLVSVSASKTRKYEIQNSDIWFSESCGLPSVRQWMEKAIIDHGKLYLVVGYQTLIDAEVNVDFRGAGGCGTGAQMSTAAAAFGLPVSNPLLDTGFEVSCGSDKVSSQSLVSPGEKIYALAYRRIKFNWFSSRAVSPSFLCARTKWKLYWSARGEEDIEEEDIIEAVLTSGANATNHDQGGAELD